MQNLYDRIQSLVKEKQELNRRGGILKYDARREIPEAKEEFDKIVARYKQVEAEIDRIEQDYAIGIEEMGEIISKSTGLHYIPKIFRKIYADNEGRYYTFKFVACYINQNHPYYANQEYSISLFGDEYENLINNLDVTKSIVFSSNLILNYQPLFPRIAFEHTNFIKQYIYGLHSINEISCDFLDKTEPLLRQDLENVNVIVNDEKYDQGL